MFVRIGSERLGEKEERIQVRKEIERQSIALITMQDRAPEGWWDWKEAQGERWQGKNKVRGGVGSDAHDRAAGSRDKCG